MPTAAVQCAHSNGAQRLNWRASTTDVATLRGRGDSVDVWGQIYIDEWQGRSAPRFIERDDGLIHRFESAAHYFIAPRSEPERELLDGLTGPVLDIGAGAGAYSLYLQQRGIEVTPGDSSTGAIRVCSARGCRDARLMDIRTLHLPDAQYRGIIVMGNTLGLHQTPRTLPGFFRCVYSASAKGAHMVVATIDPLATDDPAHLAYHQRNRERGLPPGLAEIRLRYHDLVSEWVPLWLPTTAELDAAVAGSGWNLRRRYTLGPHRIDCYVAGG